jgi:hypothetical protein
MIDPRELLEQARPGPSPNASPFTPNPDAIRRTRETLLEDHEGRPRSVSELDGTNPANYMQKVPPPPCGFCQQDHNPIGEARGAYGHPYVFPDQTPSVPTVSNGSPAPVPSPIAVQPSPAQRVTILPARGDDAFILGIESNPPDWDLEDSWRLSTDELLKVLPILRKLNVKIRDNTAGELKSLELERAGS